MGVVGRNPNSRRVRDGDGCAPTESGQPGRLLLTLKPQGQRPPADQIIQQLRPRLAAIPGVRSFLQMPPAIQIGGQSSSSTYQFQLQGTNADTLYAVARRFEQRMHGLSGVQDVVSNLQITNPQVSVHIDRDRADALGVTPAAIESALYGAFGSAQVSTIYTPSNQYWVVMELLPQYQRDPAALDRLYVTSSSGGLVPLSSVATVSSTVGPLSVNHAGQLPSVTISFNLAPGISLGEAQSRDPGVGTSGAARGGERHLRRRRPGVPERPERNAVSPGRGGVRDLRDPRRPLRELCSPDHHPLDQLPSAGVGALLMQFAFEDTTSQSSASSACCFSSGSSRRMGS